jgi:hypothetical protein
LEAAVAKLCSEKSDLEKEVVELQSRADQIERRSNEQKLAEEKKHADQIQYLKRANQQLKVISLYNRYSMYKFPPVFKMWQGSSTWI